MSSEEIEIIPPKEKKEKNPKRVAAGKKGVEVRMRNAEMRKKENERLKKENEKFKIENITRGNNENMQITKNDNAGASKANKSYKEYYIPAFVILTISGIGLYFYNSKNVKQETLNEKETVKEQTSKKQEEKETVNYKW